MDITKFMQVISETGIRERGKYHLTFGKLIEALKGAKETDRISPKITGIGAYRGYYSDMALMTETVGTSPMYTEDIYEEIDGKYVSKDHNVLRYKIDNLSENPHELAKQLESMLGKYTDGYKGGCNLVTEKTSLWVAADYGDCSSQALIGIGSDLKLITKEIA